MCLGTWVPVQCMLSSVIMQSEVEPALYTSQGFEFITNLCGKYQGLPGTP